MSGIKQEMKAQAQSMEASMEKMMAMIQGLAAGKPKPEKDEEEETVPAAEDRSKPSSSKVNVAFKPDNLTLDYTLAQFKTWKARFQDYYRMNKLGAMDDGDQAAHVRSCMTMQVQDHLRLYMHLKEDSSCEEALELLEQYFSGKSNITSRRVEFSNCRQRGGETFEEFFVRLSLLQEDSDPCKECQETQLVTRLIAGVADSDLRQELLRIKEPGVIKIKDACHNWELARKEDRQLTDRGRANKVSG